MTEQTRCSRKWCATLTMCRCERCAPDAYRTRKAIEAGLLPPARSDEAWDVLDRLLAAGWTSTAIESATGVPKRGIEDAIISLKVGPRRTFGRVIADRIINHRAPTRGYIGAWGPRRRLQALAVMGWGLDDLTEATGLPIMTLSTIRSGRVTRTRPQHAAAIAIAFHERAMTIGPSPQATDRARRAGWVGPLAWDDDIDDVDAVPHGVPTGKTRARRGVDEQAVALALAGPASTPDLTAEERRLVVARLSAVGCSAPQIATHLRVTARTIQRDREALGLVVHRAEAAS